jgi:hypothetical protein
MKVLYLPIDERVCNYKQASIYFINNSRIELNTIPIKYMGRMKNPGDIDGIFSYLEEVLPSCDFAILSFELLMYGGYLPSRVHHLSIEQLQDRFRKLESLLRSKKGKSSKIYLYSNIMMTTKYSSSENDCNYYSNYGEFIFTRSYLMDKKKNTSLNKSEEKELDDCIKMIPYSVLKDYEQRVDTSLQMQLNCTQLLESNVVDYLAINMKNDFVYGYESIAQKEMMNYFEQHKVNDKVLNCSEMDEGGFALICRAILLYSKIKIKISYIFDCDISPLILFSKKKKLQGLFELLGVVYTSDIDDCDLILFFHSEKYSDIRLDDKAYNELIKLRIPFMVVDDVFENKADSLFVRLMFENGISDNLLTYSCSKSITRELAFGLIQYKYGTKELRDNALLDTMIFEYAFKSHVRDKYAKILYDRSVGKLIHINDNDVELKGLIKRDIEFELYKLYKTLPHAIKQINFPWYRLDDLEIIWG